MGIVRKTASLAGIIVLFGYVFGACSRTAVSPNPTDEIGPRPRPAAPDLTIIGPSSVPPNETVQFRAVVRDDNNDQPRDVTDQAIWTVRSATSATVLTFPEPGLAKGGDRGKAWVMVSWSKQLKILTIDVRPTGTFVVTGFTFPGPVRVDVMSGASAGLFTMSNNNGEYVLYGVGGDVELRATRDGYEPDVKRLQVTSDTKLNFSLKPALPLLNVAGFYKVTVTASDQCADFPTELRTRTYQWELRESSAGWVEARGPGYPLIGDLQVDRVWFRIDPWDLGWVVLERLSATTALVLQGDFALFPTSSGLSGTVDGALGVSENASVRWCRWPTLTLTR